MKTPLKPLTSPNPAASAYLRHLSADTHPSSPPSPPLAPPSPELSGPISKTLSLLQSTDPSSWPSIPNLQTLLSSLNPPSVLKLTRQFPNYQNALNFFNHLKSTSLLSDSLPLAFQAVLELALRGNRDSAGKLYELFMVAKDQSIPLSVNAATLLIKCFGQANMLDEMIMVYDAIDVEMVNTDVLNLVIAGLLRWGRVDHALKLLDEMLGPDSGYPPNSNTAGIVFSFILKRNWSGRNVTDEEIYNLVSKFCDRGGAPHRYWFTQVITRFCRNGESEKAWSLLHEVMDSGSELEVASCNALLTRLGQDHDFTRLNLLMKEMKEKGIEPDNVTYGIMIKQLCMFRRIDEAMEVLNKMKSGELGIEPDVVVYNTLIDGLCKVGRQEEGLALMMSMMGTECKPNTVTYNCLIDGFCKAGEIETGYQLYEQMSKEGVEESVITLNTLLDAECRQGNVSGAMKLFGSKKENGLKGNSVTYTILICAFCNVNNIDKALKLFDEMRENGCSPDAIVYYSLISGLSQAGRMNDAASIVSKLKNAGFGLDILSYNILISGYCRKNKLNKASEMLKDMEKSGVKPDRYTYNTLISYFCSNGDFMHAHRVMSKMIDDGLKPTVVTYGALIQGYCTHDNIDEAMKIFKDLSSSLKVKPNTVIYNMLIDSFCKIDDVEAALCLMDDMKDKEVKPNSTTYNALFKGLMHRNWFEKALQYMDQMTEQACSPDYITMEILNEWLPAVGEMEKLKKFLLGEPVSPSTV